ncbi:class I SAM-dependent methyltransferase [Paenibacillus thermotolerans]|uniref:class I SAM-dependent methyltransferase n=1 Tax=Paenibacillus thermotolerans TaxID=3027807 RepID=UPI002368B623|nr:MULTISPECIES: class I SAM-dependent methyltransferase [unclassified Paenibacillus]
METFEWDDQAEYLLNSRYMFFNDDYLEFLVKRVWSITEPVNMIDFGCGIGYLGYKLLPYLPEGSTYTGVDRGNKLIERAREIFSGLPFVAEFIVSDVNKLQVEESAYDIAICQALLMHLPNPKEIMGKMMRSVKRGGRLICIEPHWNSAMANFYVHEIEQSKIVNLGILQKLYELDFKRTGKDGNIGIKIPIYMRELGLTNIGSRISDRVNFLHPDADDKEKLYRTICDEGFSAPPPSEEKFVGNLIKRGLSEEEARSQFEAELLLHTEFSQNGLQYHSIFAGTMRVSYGTKQC